MHSLESVGVKVAVTDGTSVFWLVNEWSVPKGGQLACASHMHVAWLEMRVID